MDGHLSIWGYIDTEMTDIKVIHDGDGYPIGTIATWNDGTKTKAICDVEDRPYFNLDFGITICIAKKLFGSSAYNKEIRNIHKIIEEQEAEYKKKRIKRLKRKYEKGNQKPEME